MSLQPSWESIVDPYRPEHVTPVGYDFTLKSIERLHGRGTITKDQKVLPSYHAVHPQGELYRLQPGLYLVEFEEIVSIPTNFIGLMWPRSTLVRCGVDMATAIWDAGYIGRSKSTINVISADGVNIEPGSRIGHMIMVPTSMASSLYVGQYQGEGVT